MNIAQKKYSFLIMVLLIPFLSFAQESNIEIKQTPLSSIISEYEHQDSLQHLSTWPNFSTKHLSDRLIYLKQASKAIKTIKNEDLEIEQMVNKDLLTLLISNEIAQLEYQSYLFPLNAEGGFLTEILYNIRGRNISTAEDFDKYQQDLSEIPAYISLRQSHLQEGMKQGKMMPKLIVKHCITLIQGILDSPNSSFYMTPVQNKDQWSKKVLLTLNTKVFPAYLRLKRFLENTYLPAAPSNIGVSEMTEGKSFYEQRVRFFTTLDIHPKEVYEIGVKEVKRIRKAMEAIIQSVEFEGEFSEFLNFLRTDPRFYASTPEALLKEAAWITKQMEGKLPKYFGLLPRMPLAVVPVPKTLAPNYTGGRYSPGSYANKKSGEFWVNTFDLPSRPLYVLPALALHEGVPGHHTQIMLAAEAKNTPAFRNNTYLSAFGEGWALYAEYLGKEAGIYDNPYKEFGRLTYEMWRACRLVVDPGMHYFGWSRERAVNFMTENTALSIREVNSEIDRYIGWPGQAVSYKMGEIKIRTLRKEAEEQLGSAFDIRAFHDLILSQGSVPLKTLDRMVRFYLKSNK